MQTLFTWLLMIVLAGSVLSLLAMGLGQVRRANRLARQAHRARMSFAGADPFDIPIRYRNLALIDSGHSAHAHNLTYGRLERWSVRACDFRFESGHGTRRLTRHYSVALAETDLDLPATLMWHEQDQDNAPMAVRQSELQQGPWLCAADPPGQPPSPGTRADALLPRRPPKGRLPGPARDARSRPGLPEPPGARAARAGWSFPMKPLQSSRLRDTSAPCAAKRCDRGEERN